METETPLLTAEEIYRAEARWWNKYALRELYEDDLNAYLHDVARKKVVETQVDEHELS